MLNIRVAIIEDDHETRDLLQLIIDGSPGFICDRAYEKCEDGIDKILKSPPDILLLDIDLPGMNGVECARKIRLTNRDILILMLTIHDDSESVFESLCAGANGYLIKGTPPVEILDALNEVYLGGAPMSPAIAHKVVSYFHRDTQTNLTNRELEILQLLCDGGNYTTISDALYISKNTVKGHIKSIYNKLHVSNRAEAVLKAHKSRLIR